MIFFFFDGLCVFSNYDWNLTLCIRCVYLWRSVVEYGEMLLFVVE